MNKIFSIKITSMVTLIIREIKKIQRTYLSTVYNCVSRRELTQGFTLVELIVSLALFIVVVFITTSAFLNVTHLYKKAAVTRTAMDTLNVAVEHIARNLRVATNYDCGYFYSGYGTITPNDCTVGVGGSTAISFINPSGKIGAYQRKTTLPSGLGSGYIQSMTPGSNCCDILTGDDIDITKLQFYVTGATSADKNQPRVNIVIQGYAVNDPDKTKFSIYTSVTQRAPK